MFKIERKPVHPGEILKEEFLNPFGISQTQLAHDLDTSVKTINELINEKRNLSSELALKLSRYFGTSAELWLNLQNQFDIYRILKHKGKEISKVRPLKASA
ncbi:MAG: HigA family addiction module antitoxin [Ignavibacteria bacterium]|nr:HigA family addiction module antitoxin [Ignavibacteria bacterium]